MHVKAHSPITELSQADLFKKISDICSSVNNVKNSNHLLEVSLKKIIDLFVASRGSIFILKDNGKDLILKAKQGIDDKEQGDIVKQMGKGIVGRVAQSKRPIFVDDIAQDDRFMNFKARGSYCTPSFICAPLMIKDKLIGVINIADKESGHRFSKNEMQLLDFLTSQIALNYRRIQLYQKFKGIVKEKENLKMKLGQTGQETEHLKKKIIINEKLATIGKLAGGIAHEFNNPLDGVMRYTNLCLRHVKDDEVVRSYLLEIKHGLNRMANIVKNLLACSRNVPVEKRMIDFKGCLKQVENSLEMALKHKKISVKKDIKDKIPVILDMGLDRILSNLFQNSIDAMEQGGEIFIQADYRNAHLSIVFKDTGCGMSEDELNRIFEPFYTTKDMDKGCGLGLTIVGEIIKSYDGKIDVESKPGAGTTFTFHLPINQKS